jgi:nucleoside-diphosphate-sugar epimerase
MLEHHRAAPWTPARAVILGAAGFVGRATADRLARAGVPVVRIGRAEIDLARPGARTALAALLRPDDAVVFAAARAPCRTADDLAQNIAMGAEICGALAAAPVDHVVYISSDAVYADSDAPLTEASLRAPDVLHGIMHVAREAMLREAWRGRAWAILRPTLIYGAADPHNGYGATRFLRDALAGKDIVLFGQGEERRDHVLIDDVAAVIAGAVLRRSTGVLNIATGELRSFHEIATRVLGLVGGAAKIASTPRAGPMPHRGYRPFDVAALRAAFPDFRPTALPDGIAAVRAALSGR